MRAVKEVMEQKAAGKAAGAAKEEASTVGRALSAPGRTRQFLHEVRMEMRNVTWPTMKDVQATTVVVLVATFFFGFYLGLALDYPLGRVMGWLMRMGRVWVS